MSDACTAIHGLNHAISSITSRSTLSKSTYAKLVQQSKQTPRTSDARLQISLSDPHTHSNPLRPDDLPQDETYLYLGYGSNMSALSFLVRRQIRPLSQVNVVVPEFQLTFDLPGIAYAEPCFGNVRYRDPNTSDNNEPHQEKAASPLDKQDYHKNRWHKGLVGVVYEVTASDYAHILATEGGGAAYADVLVDCYTLSSDPSQPVPQNPTGTHLKAHTLFSPNRSARPDPSYAQPSARYLKLLTDGADEHDLPTEYKLYLSQIRTYKATTSAQQLGAWIFLAVWGPVFGLFFRGAAKIFLRPDGTYPEWFAKLAAALFMGAWNSYDNFFKPLFGDGERSIADGGHGSDLDKESGHETAKNDWDEKTPLLKSRKKQDWSEPGTRRGDEMV